jgi:putative ABC transport system substrate-binding protein
MRRREFITMLGGAAVAWPKVARAEQPAKVSRIGIVDDSPRWNAFRHALRDLGYLEGQNLAFDYAYGDGMPEPLADAAAQLVRRSVDVIATYGLRGLASHEDNSHRDDFSRRSRAGWARHDAGAP